MVEGEKMMFSKMDSEDKGIIIFVLASIVLCGIGIGILYLEPAEESFIQIMALLFIIPSVFIGIVLGLLSVIATGASILVPLIILQSDFILESKKPSKEEIVAMPIISLILIIVGLFTHVLFSCFGVFGLMLQLLTFTVKKKHIIKILIERAASDR